MRKISAPAPGYGLPGVGQSQDKDSNHINMEGALQPLDWKDMEISAWGQDVSPKRDLVIRPGWNDSVQFTWTTSVLMTARIEITGDNGPQVQERVKRRRKDSESLTVGNGSFTFVIRCQDKDGRTAQVDGSFPPLRVNPPPGQAFREALAKMVLNREENLAKKGQNDFPWIVPPIYGQWHTQRSETDPGRSSWLDELNLDPRHRVAAGAGAQVIRDQQEALMASAWDQVGDIEAANELIRHAQLGCELSLAVHDRMQLLKPEDYLRVVGSKMKSIPWDNPARATPSPRSYTVYGKLLADRADLLPAIEPTFARVTRPRGALRKRQYRLPSQSMRSDVLFRLNAKDLIVCGAHPNPPGIIHFGKILKDWDATSSPNKSRVKLLSKISSAKNVKTRIAQPSDKTPLKSSQQQSVAQFVPVDLIALGPEMFAKALNPLKTIPSLANQRLQFRGMPVREKVQTLDLIMAAPRFPLPMYEGLREVSQDFILPGLEKVPNNTLALLKPNMRFIEAYFCGLNHEFSKELEWREYPTDKKGSYFRQFWDRAEFVQPEGFQVQLHQAQAKYLGYQLGKKPSQISDEEALDELLKDVKPISEWKAARLGENRNVWGDQQVKENLVLLIRGDLLRKYPNTVIYAIEAWDWPQGSTKRRPAMR
ncbi:MAG: hypothetical protein KC592_20350, partial [Nitrospira sp.]|nr:hypothetical protein [Nitrospira sp.]